jgi:hypothetical protein
MPRTCALILLCAASNLACKMSLALSRQRVPIGKRHEAHHYYCDGIVGRGNVIKRNPGGRGIARQSTPVLHRQSCSFRGAAVRAHRQLACQSDLRDHPAKRQCLPNDFAGLDAMAGTASATRTGVPHAMRPCQSERPTSYFPSRCPGGVLNTASHGIILLTANKPTL